jgi:hypothetical protein
MKDKFDEGIAFLERLNEAVTGVSVTIERARLQQIQSMMHINRAN